MTHDGLENSDQPDQEEAGYDAKQCTQDGKAFGLHSIPGSRMNRMVKKAGMGTRIPCYFPIR